MLQFLRGAAASWVVKIMFVLLIASFAIWGIGDIFRSRGPDTTVAEVGSYAISAAELDVEFRRQINTLRQSLGPEFDVEQARSVGVLEQSLDQLVQRALFQLASRDLGLAVNDTLVTWRLQQQRRFQDETGRFDPERFRRFLAESGMTESGYVAMIREQMSADLIRAAVATGARPPEALVDAVFRARGERRSADTIRITAASLPEPAAPDEPTLRRYHEDHAVQFTAPEYRSLAVGLLTADNFSDRVEVSEADLVAAFEQRGDEFSLPERRWLRQVVVDSRAEADQLVARAATDGGLDAAAAAFKLDVIKLDASTLSALADMGPAAFAAPVGTVAEPVETPLGWHVLIVDKMEEGREAVLADVRDRLRVELAKEKAIDRLYEYANKLDDMLGGGASLEDVAATQALTLVKLAAVSEDGKAPDGGPVTLPSNGVDLARVLQTGFSLSGGGTSPVVETEGGGFYLVRADDITPARLRPFEDVQDQVVAAWRAEQRQDAAAALGRTAAERLRNRESVAEIATAVGGVAGTVGPLTRADETGGRAEAAGDGELDPALRAGLFGAAADGVVDGPVEGGYMVVRVREILAADAKADAAGVEKTREALARDLGNDLLSQFVRVMRESYPVSVNERLVQSLYQQN